MSTKDKKQKRFPSLGKIGIGILENLVKPILGEETIKEIKSPLVEKQLRDSLEIALQNTEKRFVKEHTDAEFREAVLNLPIADMPSLADAVIAYYDNLNNSMLSEALRKQLQNLYPKAAPSRIENAAKMYVKILREELAATVPTIREKLITLSNLMSAEKLDQIYGLLKEKLETSGEYGIHETTQEGTIEINPINRMGHNIFHSPRGELRFFVNTHFHIKSNIDAEILTLSLDYGSEQLGIEQHVVVDNDVYETIDYIILVKPINLIQNKVRRIELSRSFLPPLDYDKEDVERLDYGNVLISLDVQFVGLKGIFHQEENFNLAPGGKLLPI